MQADVASRLTLVEALLADPPAVHPMSHAADAPIGVWSTEPGCYRFIAEHCPPGSRTLETGSGLSTVLFSALGADHICCTPAQDEADRVVAHCTSRGFPTEHLRFEVGSSHETLPVIERRGEVRDLVLIDGCHGFPLPVVDWFYGASTLRAGGILVIDDVNLPAVRVARGFLDQDPRWQPMGGTEKWRAWRRLHDGPLAEDWTAQPWFRTKRDRVRQLRQGAQVRVERLLGRRR
ncbi:MAG: class I SAM-dependent methyltransferase [Actinomycetota bacterium]|nr:class I SAM-dependent methyltransferase [Actinomycetota bacterium]